MVGRGTKSFFAHARTSPVIVKLSQCIADRLNVWTLTPAFRVACPFLPTSEFASTFSIATTLASPSIVKSKSWVTFVAISLILAY